MSYMYSGMLGRSQKAVVGFGFQEFPLILGVFMHF